MSQYLATIRWQRQGADILKGQYSREHTWAFDGGVTVPASASPHVVPLPWSNPANIDPEEAFVAAVSSCHMLTFIWLAARAGFQPDSYEDEAAGIMTKNARGVPWVSQVTLRPRLAWSGTRLPSAEEIDHLHHEAHQQCFIAQSIKTDVIIQPTSS